MSPMRAGLVPLILLVAVGGTLTNARAQDAKKVAAGSADLKTNHAAPGISVLVVDVQSLLQNSKSAKMVRQQIEQKRAEYAKEISRQEEQLRKARDTLQRQAASLSPTALKQKGSEFQQKVNDLDRSVQAKRQALERSNDAALQKIQSAILHIITDIAKERKANLVLKRSAMVLWDQGFDVTDDVLKKLDEQLPTLTVDFVAPKEESPPAAASEARTTSSRKHRR
ncbi:MAG TPA: OmpH family outer membrane protein [Stellaceae bacterium]|nr:OmpH family outer membrane protein [Stellaceae bacterium]